MLAVLEVVVLVVVGDRVVVKLRGLPILNPSTEMTVLGVVSAPENRSLGFRNRLKLSSPAPGFSVDDSFSFCLLLFDTNGLCGFN